MKHPRAINLPSEPGLYVHLPFCPAKCPYCDFFSLPFRPAAAARLLEAMLAHLPRVAARSGGRRLAHLYLGGGTPSMWPAASLARLVEAVRESPGLLPGAEVTLEANPGTLSAAKLEALLALGINRLSLGAQTFQPGLAETLGRRGGPGAVERAVRLARAAGFGNLSLDLIYGLPGQTPEMFREDLDRALALEPEHFSLYELTLSPETPFGRRYVKGEPPLPAEEAMEAMEEAAYRMLEGAGLMRYEVSNFARPGRECRHNLNTWAGGDYLALGPGAQGHLAGERWGWAAEVEAYARAVERGDEPPGERESLTPGQRALELGMLGLRTTAGADLAIMESLLGEGRAGCLAGTVDRLIRRGWAVCREGRLVPTARGLAMADAAAETLAEALL